MSKLCIHPLLRNACVGFLLAAIASGCDSKITPEEVQQAEPAVKAAAVPAGDQPAKATADGTVEVAKSGTKFDPPVDKSKIPDGAWMCDMGSVHYASLDPGDGKCPTCGMKLVRKGASAANSHGGGSGHQH